VPRTTTVKWLIRSLLVAAVVAVCAIAGWQAFRPNDALGGPGLGGLGPVWYGSTSDSAHPHSSLVGTWREQGGSHVVLRLGANGLATFDLSLDGSVAWTDRGSYRVAGDTVIVSLILVGPSPDGGAGSSAQETYTYAHGLLSWPGDEAVFAKQG
jgi:hypothetical protein